LLLLLLLKTGVEEEVAELPRCLQVDCVDQAMIRSYAILTRSATAAGVVVTYHGVSVPAGG
jgi:hypothetical protein